MLFLLLHDWVPLGTLNDLKAVRTADSFGKRVAATLMSATPFAVGLVVERFARTQQEVD